MTKLMKQSLSTIMTNAWVILRKGLADSFSSALKLAWFKYRFVKSLIGNKVSFSYLTSNGSVRMATGTLKTSSVNSLPGNGKYGHTVTYFDLEKNDWRSFIVSSFLGLVSN